MEKKLTDEEIVKALECCATDKIAEVRCPECILEEENGCCTVLLLNALDLIHRLQDDYSKLKKRYIKVLDLNEKVIAEQKAEIEQLTEENTQLEKDVHDMSWVIKIHKYCVGANHCQNRRDGEFELQRQVDELKSENTELYKEHTTLIAGSILEKQETAKDTAREILDDLRNIFIEQSSYGSDANQHIGYYDYEVKMGLVIEQIEEYAKEKYSIEYGVEVE